MGMKHSNSYYTISISYFFKKDFPFKEKRKAKLELGNLIGATLLKETGSKRNEFATREEAELFVSLHLTDVIDDLEVCEAMSVSLGVGGL